MVGNLIAIRCLVLHQAAINVQEKDEGSKRSFRRTPLHNASWRGHWVAVRLLLDYKASPFILNSNKETPLFEAIWEGHLGAARIFWSRGIWLPHSLQRVLKKEISRQNPHITLCVQRLLQDAALNCGIALATLSQQVAETGEAEEARDLDVPQPNPQQQPDLAPSSPFWHKPSQEGQEEEPFIPQASAPPEKRKVNSI